MAKAQRDFLAKLKDYGEFNGEACMNCGTCTGICPLELKALPREVFRYAVLGLEAKIRNASDDIFSCLLCGKCEENCPAKVKIPENIRTLRNYINSEIHQLR